MEDQATSLRKLIRKNEYEYKDKQGNAPTQAQAVSPQPAVTAHPALGGAQHQPRVYRPQNFDFAQQQPTQSTAQPPYQQAAPSAQSVMNAQPASQMTPHPTMPNYAQSFNAQAQGTSFSQQRTVSTQSPVQAAPQMQASRIGAQPVQPNQPTQQAPSKLHIFRPVSSAQPTKDVEAKGSRTIAITSGKGGVGKTNLTVNLAIALGREGKRVLIIDADLGMANVDVVLGTSSKYHLMQLLEPGVTLEDIIIHGPYGVNYISGGSAMEKAVDLSQFDRSRLMEKLARCAEMADIILIDTGAGLGKNVLEFILAADEVILITTPEPTALTDAYGVMKAYSNLAAEKDMRLVVNRIYDEEECADVLTKLRRTSEKFLSMPLESLGAIYEDRNVMNAVKKQTPLLAVFPNTLAARCIDAIAKNLLYGPGHDVKWGWRGFLQKLLKFKG